MGAGAKFEIEVRALDRFTKTFRDLNNRASKAARPLVNVQRQVGALGREMHLDKVAKGMGKVSDAAVNVSRTLGLSLGPLESMLSIGSAGGIVGVLTAAGAAAVGLGVNFARTGFEVARTSTALGISAGDLQRLRGAAKLAGVEVGSIDQAVVSLGDTLQNARWNRDIGAAMALSRLHIGIPMKGGQVDTLAALRGVAEVMRQIPDAHTRNTVADTLHIPREAIPLLMQGAQAMEKLGDESERQGTVVGPKALQSTIAFTNSLNLLKVAAEGAGNSLGLKLLPPMATSLDYVTKMITQSGKSSTSAAGAGISDFFSAGPRSLGWLRDTMLRGHTATTAAERTVSGKIGDAPASAPTAPPGVTRSRGEQAMASQMAFTPEELARQQADEDSAGNRRELMRAIQSTRDPAARAVLQGELTKLQSRPVIEINVSRLPADAVVTARVKDSTTDGYTPTRIDYSFARDAMP